MPLTAISVEKAKPKEKDYKLSDERGLYLQVKRNGSKYWRFKYRFNKKEKLLALGVYPDISLKDARVRRDDARKLHANGTDPGDVKRAKKTAQGEASANSFELVAREWYEKEKPHWSESHYSRVWRLLEKDLFPYLGSRPISDISPTDLLSVLRRIEARGAIETTHRAKQVSGQVFRYGVATGRADRDPSTDLRDALKQPKETHFAALTEPKQISPLLVALDNYQGTPVVKAALRLSPLLFCRPGELRHMEWSEIDWEVEQWELPAEKMKLKRPHIVPLPSQALDILTELHPLTGRGRYVFPSARGASRPLSENGVRTALRSMGYSNEQMTPHGFRAMARTLLDEVLDYPPHLIEHQLAHAVRDPNGRAYNRTSHLPQRKEMMQIWANYLDKLRENNFNQ